MVVGVVATSAGVMTGSTTVATDDWISGAGTSVTVGVAVSRTITGVARGV